MAQTSRTSSRSRRAPAAKPSGSTQFVGTALLVLLVGATTWFGFQEWNAQRREAAAWRRVGSCAAADSTSPTVTCVGVTLVDLTLPRRFAACAEILNRLPTCTVSVNAEALNSFQAAIAEIDTAGLGRHVTEFQTVNRRRCKSASTGSYIAGCISKHSYGIAVDIRPFADNVRWNSVVAEEPGLTEIVAIFKRHGFRWGMEFAGNPDPQHFEWIPQ